MNILINVIIIFFLFNPYALTAQLRDESSLEGILVEKYFEVKRGKKKLNDHKHIYKGMFTYRIYVDLKPGYLLQAVYGSPDHPLFISTSTKFYNSYHEGAETGNFISADELNSPHVALDSWFTIGAAAKGFWGIPVVNDNDGSILKWMKPAGSDGLKAGDIPDLMVYGIPMDVFKNIGGESSELRVNNGAWAVLGGTKGPDVNNQILIAQITTDGTLSFEINLQIGTPDCAVIEKYVARDPESDEIQSDMLVFPFKENPFELTEGRSD
jgi:hypothetical protein